MAIPVLIIIKTLSTSELLVLETFHLKIELPFLEVMLFVICLFLFLLILLKWQLGGLRMNQEKFSVFINASVIYILIVVSFLFIITQSILSNPSGKRITTTNQYIYTQFLPFIWIPSVFVAYSEYMHKWIPKPISPEPPAIQMAVVSTGNETTNMRRASIDTTVSYLSINEINVEI
ncbi:hypothetical protein GCK72_001580 [Caenorhabditis remanei]|uniref:Uncharacterized protein n=1 Tax=Caenorhabditis remanei TaxID=31234 RepID=A0A6A5HU61_CAERE|nr:hypothetical protein GCK72_001580 [Caenorhabditis remanei]KAF1769763.1 hypothetical protein GCK72_001580 [Caenorhabditis remanei]